MDIIRILLTVLLVILLAKPVQDLQIVSVFPATPALIFWQVIIHVSAVTKMVIISTLILALFVIQVVHDAMDLQAPTALLAIRENIFLVAIIHA